jgi:hypothetical protein
MTLGVRAVAAWFGRHPGPGEDTLMSLGQTVVQVKEDRW